jgi:hypothetical protein
MVRKAEIPVVPDDQMVQHLNAHQHGRPDQIPRQALIFGRRRRVPGRMIVNKHHSCCLMIQGKGDNFAGINSTTGQTAFKHIAICNDFIFSGQEKNPEDLSFEVSHGMEKVIEYRLGGAKKGFSGNSISKISFGRLMNQPQIKGIFLPDTLDSP